MAKFKKAIRTVRLRLIILGALIVFGSAVFFKCAIKDSLPVSAGIFLAGDAIFQLRLWPLAAREGWIAGQPFWYMTTLWAQLAIGASILILAVAIPFVTR